MLVLMFFALVAGIATVLSPCVLPVLPALLSSSATSGKWRPFGVVIGLVFSFAFFTLALTTLVQHFGFSANALRYTAILIIALFGFVMISPFFTEKFASWTASVANLGNKIQFIRGANKTEGFLSGLILGVALGLVWTPCAGPILAAITALVATQHVTWNIVMLTLAYSVGAGIPLLGIAYGGNRIVRSVPFFSERSEWIRQGFGWIMILTALALAFNFDIALQKKILDFLPKVEIQNSSWVEKQLQALRPPPLGFPGSDTVPEIQHNQGGLPKIAPAPELVGLTNWLNSMPLSIKGLKGKVILIDFWTYSCINCIRTFPYLINWWDTYKDKGLVIIGIHTPEFEFEKDFDNVAKAVKRFGIEYPVALDNHYATWTAYHNSYWPAHYLIDQSGIVRQVHFGEGGYLETENAIRYLLNEPQIYKESVKVAETSHLKLTPETYLGFKRASKYASSIVLNRDVTASYNYTEPLKEDQVGLKGSWLVEAEKIVSEGQDSSLELSFIANRVYLVLGGSSSQPITVELDEKPISSKYYTKDMNDKGQIFVQQEPRKYDVVDLKGDYGRHTLVLRIPKGIEAYAFTFGSE